ncbi:MAG TPA: hypothetical protein VHX37_11360 [Acidobacteriaceae bacterium]|jgi:hypothetical protein|nr:hypothetical protein [Acidobacteriaceae bacterium]
MPKVTGTIVVMATALWGASLMHAATTSGATRSVIPTSGVSSTNVTSPQSSCIGQLWSCIDDPVGYPDGDSSYVYTTASPASHVIGFASSYSQITSVTMHIVAASYSGGSGTVTMSFYNGSELGGQGGAKTIAANSGYAEYVSGIFYTSVANLGDITMKIALTGSVKYTAAWMDITYGGSGTSTVNLAPYMNNSSGAWSAGSCTTSACAGGAGNATVAVTPNVTVPSGGPYPTGTDVLTSTSDTKSGDTDSALEWVKLTSSSQNPTLPSSIASLTGDWWVYPTNETTDNPRTLEFDTFFGDGAIKAMWGSHCSLHDSNSNGQVWYLDAQDGEGWQPAINSLTGQTIPCNLTPNQWHHITWQVHLDLSAPGGGTTGKLYYDYLTVDGTTYNMAYASKTHSLVDSTWTTLGIQAQQDLNAESAQSSITEYVDSMSFTWW